MPVHRAATCDEADAQRYTMHRRPTYALTCPRVFAFGGRRRTFVIRLYFTMPIAFRNSSCSARWATSAFAKSALFKYASSNMLRSA